MAEPRHWPALVVRAAAIDEHGDLDGLVTLALDDTPPLAIEDLAPMPLPPGGLWDPTAPPPLPPPPAPLAWRICFKDDADRTRAAAAIAALDRELSVESVDLPDDDWVARSQQALTAVVAGPFVVAPPWDIPEPRPARLIVIEPSMGFGTGHHATTRLCLAALGDLDVRGHTVVDVGTGSGVLALAAAQAGAAAVIGLDIDEDAVAAARRSAALNPAIPPVTFTVADIAADAAPADVVVANLTGAMLRRDAAILARRVAPGGHLVVSGFMDDERTGVEAALVAFAVERRLAEDGWCAAVLRRL
ncbi:MAG: 50S ribosomal protein L11 methyltransferase [Vicinamibacterales bacterium]